MSRKESSAKQPTSFLGFLLVVYGVAFIGYLGVRRGIPGWYDSLIHPPLAIPPWCFGPIWSAIYLLIGYGGWELWRAEKTKARRLGLIFFGIQLVLNSVWTWLFFGLQRPLGSFVEIVFLWIAILATIFGAFKVRPAIAGILVPYLLWVSFAAYLNFGIWNLNYRNHEGVGRIQTIVNP